MNADFLPGYIKNVCGAEGYKHRCPGVSGDPERSNMANVLPQLLVSDIVVHEGQLDLTRCCDIAEKHEVE